MLSQSTAERLRRQAATEVPESAADSRAGGTAATARSPAARSPRTAIITPRASAAAGQAAPAPSRSPAVRSPQTAVNPAQTSASVSAPEKSTITPSIMLPRSSSAGPTRRMIIFRQTASARAPIRFPFSKARHLFWTAPARLRLLTALWTAAS